MVAASASSSNRFAVLTNDASTNDSGSDTNARSPARATSPSLASARPTSPAWQAVSHGRRNNPSRSRTSKTSRREQRDPNGSADLDSRNLAFSRGSRDRPDRFMPQDQYAACSSYTRLGNLPPHPGKKDAGRLSDWTNQMMSILTEKDVRALELLCHKRYYNGEHVDSAEIRRLIAEDPKNPAGYNHLNLALCNILRRTVRHRSLSSGTRPAPQGGLR